MFDYFSGTIDNKPQIILLHFSDILKKSFQFLALLNFIHFCKLNFAYEMKF